MPLEDLGLKGMLTFSKDKKEFLPGGMMLLGADCGNLIFDGHTMENSLF